MATTIRFTLFSAKEIEKAKQQLIEYQDDLNEKIDLFVKKLCEKGVEIAKEKVSVHDAIDTGELLNSIDLREGDIIKNGSQWFIYTDCDYAKFIEFGTGVVGENSPYPTSTPIEWNYASGKTIFTTIDGKTGWYYPTKDGQVRVTCTPKDRTRARKQKRVMRIRKSKISDFRKSIAKARDTKKYRK